MPGIGCDRERGLGCGLHEQIVDHPFVLVGDIGDRRRHGVDDREEATGQQLALARGEPLPRRRALALGTMPVAAGVVGDGRVRAGVVLAAGDMAAERRRAAALDCAHHLQLVETDVSAVGFTPSGTVGAEDIRDLPSWAAHVGGAYAAGSGFCLFLCRAWW